MKNPYLIKLDPVMDSTSKILSLAFKLSTLIGGGCFILYCIKLDYFPAGLSIGDSLLFVMFAASFGFLYILFISSLLSLGLCLSPILNPLLKSLNLLIKKFKKNNIRDPIEISKPDSINILFGIIGIFLIIAISKNDFMIYGNLLITTLTLVIIWSFYKESEKKLNSIINSSKSEHKKIIMEIEKFKKIRLISFIIIFIYPLFMSGSSGILLEAGMKLVNLKKKESYILIQPPYNNFIPKKFQSKDIQIKGYTTFKNVQIMLSGLGQKTVIKFSFNGQYKTLEIPNEKIILVPR